jgi:hypothetical protein
METKPLARWTVGPPRSRFDDAILRRSVINFRRFYGDVFDCLLCLNGRDARGLDGLGAEVILQKSVAGCPEPKGVAWKLYPPRIRPDSHELFIDHDVVLVDRIEKLDSFLSRRDAFLYSQAYSLEGCYGSFRNLVPEGFRLNSGFFGLPPGFRFDLSSVREWFDYFDEQGFVASSLCGQDSLIMVPLEDIHICMGDERPRAPKAYHFVHGDRDESWSRFVRSTTI